LNTCCIGPSGEDDINSTPRAATIESADRLCLASIYNCSIKRDSEPPLYQLSASDVSDLTASINAIKPAANAK
jgi:hypothetical protein